MHRMFVTIGIVLVLITSSARAEIKPFSGNPSYWQYEGKPVLLLGGSDRDNIFQWANDGDKLTSQLNTLKDVGGNYIRCTMSSREYTQQGYRWDLLPYPFKKLSSGKYDLNQWNSAYWNKLKLFLSETHKRNIIVQLEIWDMWNESGDSTKSGNGWYDSPWNPNNNINYNWSDSPLLKSGKTPFYNPFFRAPVAGDKLLLDYQKKFVARVVDEALAYDHVLFQIDNESGIDFAVGEYWAKYIRDRAKAANRTVYVADSRRFHAPTPFLTTNFRDWNNPEISVPITKIAIYTFLDISQNCGNSGQTQYDNLLWYRAKVIQNGRQPINLTKCYHFNWPTGTSFQNRTAASDAEAAAKFWRTVFGGASSIRFHRHLPYQSGNVTDGFGLTSTGQTNIKSMRMFSDSMNIFAMEPDNSLLSSRSIDEAYCLSAPTQQFAVFFTGASDRYVGIDVSEIKGPMTLRWLDVANSKWVNETTIEGGKVRDLKAPTTGHWVALLSSSTPKDLPAPKGLKLEIISTR